MLNLRPNTSTGIVPCLPCCNHVYQECGCPVNQRLNEIGSNPEIEKSVPRKYVTFFIHGLFANESPQFGKFGRLDSVLNDGANAYSVQCSGPWFPEDGLAADSIWTFGFTAPYIPLPPGRTLAAYVRFNAASKTFSAKIVVDGVDPGWSDATKTFSNEYMATLQGSSGGYTFISHSFCVCSGFPSRPDYSPCLTNAEIWGKPLYVAFSGLPACLKSSYQINTKKTFADPTPESLLPLLNAEELRLWRADYPVAGNCFGSVNADWDYVATMTFMQRATYPMCNGIMFLTYFSWWKEEYAGFYNMYQTPQPIGNIVNPEALTFTNKSGNPIPVGNRYPWDSVNGPNVTQYPNYSVDQFPDISRPIIIDFDPIFIDYSAVGYNQISDDYFVPRYHSAMQPEGRPFFLDLVHVTITE